MKTVIAIFFYLIVGIIITGIYALSTSKPENVEKHFTRLDLATSLLLGTSIGMMVFSMY